MFYFIIIVALYFAIKYIKVKKLKDFIEQFKGYLSMGTIIDDSMKASLLKQHSYLTRKLSEKKKVELIEETELVSKINIHNELIKIIANESNEFISSIKTFKVSGGSNVPEAVEHFKSSVGIFKKHNFKDPIMECIANAITLYDKLSSERGLQNLTNVRKNIENFMQLLKTPFTKYFDANDAKCIEEYATTREYLNNLEKIISILFDEKEVSYFNEHYDSFEEIVKQKNQQFIEKELLRHDNFFSNIDGYSLDKQQRKAIVTDEVNNLYVAGAGAGKTLTVVGNVKYLVEKRGVSPDRILLISFTNKAVDELQERISRGNDYGIRTTTFHKLGLSILESYTGKKQTIFSDDQVGVIKRLLVDAITSNEKAMEKFVEFMALYYIVPKDPNDYEKKSDYLQELRRQELTSIKGRMHEYEAGGRESMTTLQGETIKSIEELIIANYLYIHGINYEYEKKYIHDTSDSNYRQYYPDFYLSDYDTWLEHFGIDENGRAKWLSPFEEEKYQNGILWKRSLHEQYETKLIETYSYYSRNGNLVEKLAKTLQQNGIEIKPIDSKRIIELITREKRGRQFEEFSRLMSTFIQLFKSNGYVYEDIETMETSVLKDPNSFFKNREAAMLFLARDVYRLYEKYLKNKKMIDFADMINQATKAIEDSQMDMGFDYIFIDEYQDIAVGRYKLIKAIREQSGAKIVAVGDDWQSIYRFAGSDIGMFIDFESYFGKTEVMKIETTYRNSRELIDIAGGFIQKNPSQIKKQLKSNKSLASPVKIVEAGYSDMVTAFTAIILEIYQRKPEGEILVLGRNNYNLNPLLDSGEFTINDDNTLVYNDNPNIVMKYLTVHRSKGLEADNVIILNVINHYSGFPNQIADDPILRFVLNYSGTFSFDEERRLFYVALTRTKNNTYIMTQPFKHSEFVDELIKEYDIAVKQIGDGTDNIIEATCPKCGNNQLRLNKGPYGVFIGCGNYPLCDYKHSDVKTLRMNKKCPICGDYMVKRKGKYGEFFGCNNYPFCSHTEKINHRSNSRSGF